MKYEDALLRAKWFVAALRPACTRIEIVGSVRRGKPEVHDIELLLSIKNEKPIPEFGKPNSVYETKLDNILADLEYGDILRQASDKKDGAKYKKRALRHTGELNEFCLDLFIVLPPADWGVLSVIRTGPVDFSKWMVTKKIHGGALPDNCYVKEGAVWNGEDGSKFSLPEEEDFFRLSGMDFINPSERVAKWKR